MRALLAVLGSMAVEGPVIEWVATHRKHHRFSDQHGDPHSPHVDQAPGWRGTLRGLAHAHVGWMFRGKDMANPARYAKDLLADRDLRFISRTFPLWVAVGLAIPFGLGFALSGSLAGGLTGLLWGGAGAGPLLHHMTFSINSLCHVFGRRPFATDDESRNLAWLAPFAFGEAWHNNHHAFPTSARHGLGRRPARPRRLAHRRPRALPPGLGRRPDQPRTPAGRASDPLPPPTRPAERTTPRSAGRVTAPAAGAGLQSWAIRRAPRPCEKKLTAQRMSDEQAVLEADQVPEVDHEPGDPREEAAEVHALDVGDRAGAADGGEVALVGVVEGLGVAAGEAVGDHARRVAALLHGDRRDARVGRAPMPSGWRTLTMSPTASTSGWPGTERSRLDRQAPGAVDLVAGLLGEHAPPAARRSRPRPR